MTPNPTAINGQESIDDPSSPQAALVDFYAAFNGRDYDRMQANWLQSATASMSNPLGGIKRGWAEISAVYKKIFHGPATVYVEFYDYTLHAGADLFLAVGRERGTLQNRHETLQLAIRTTRIYTLDRGRWRQLHHHGSMDQPERLAHYQTALLGNTRGAPL